MKQQEIRVGAYCRLSRDDDNPGESGSIKHQKDIITSFCEANGFQLADFYVDDGWSGTNFNRPDFQRLITDIEEGKINCVITKDLSRLGRDYIMSGYYQEVYFPTQGVRYIAISDNFDSQNGASSSNDFAPVKNLFNDFFARDTSRKVRTVKSTKKINGEHECCYPTFGYKKDPNQKNHLIPNEETAPIVRQIFDLYLGGMGCMQIRNYLEENKVLTPQARLHYEGKRNYPDVEDKKYRWCRDSVWRILRDEIYIGNSVHLKHKSPNYKAPRKRVPRTDWMVVEGTHEPIVDKEIFEKVQKRLTTHQNPNKKHENVFLSIVKCADCGKSMNLNCKWYEGNQVQRWMKSLNCYTYTKYGKKNCSAHHTNYDKLVLIVRDRINSIIEHVHVDEEALVQKLYERKRIREMKKQSSTTKRRSQIQSRLDDLQRIFTKLFEDRALGNITEDNYLHLSVKYQEEQENLKAEFLELEDAVTEYEKSVEGIASFIDLIRSMKKVEELDRETVTTLIDRIDVHQSMKAQHGWTQQIDIYYRFVGQLD